jgi:DNA primase
VRTRPRHAAGSSRANQGIPDALLETVRERARITDLFPQADLRRRGSEFLTLCPWHQDSNASLTVSPRTNRVHCFVCNKGADPIGWLQDRHGLSFREAVEELARRYAIPLPEQDPEAAARAEAEHQDRQRLRQWRSRQEEEFHQALVSDLGAAGTAARYLEQRGISPETAIAWRLGLNASRLMLPIRDGQGRCCGFSGRSLNGEEPKYRNSSGDLLFQKSQLLFGLDRASDAIRRGGEALLVEGPLDVIQLHQAGLDNAVAALGTAVTIEQLQRLQRSGTRRLWLAYDGDSAGTNATARLIGIARPLLLRGEMDLLVVPVPPSEDPDSLLRSQGVSGLRACLAQGRHWLHWELDRLLAELQHDPDDLSVLQRCERQGAELLAQLPPGALRRKAEQRLREALGGLPLAAHRSSQGGGALRVTQGGAAERKSKSVNIEVNTFQNDTGEAEEQPQNDASVQQAERRALRLFLCNPGLREVLSVLELADPLHREAMGWLWCLQQRLAGRDSAATVAGSNPTCSGKQVIQGDGLRAAVIAAMPSMDPPLAQLLSPLLHCGEPVRVKLAAHPEPELMCILDVLEPVG